MYVPQTFRVDDPNVVAAFMRQFDFVAVVTNSPLFRDDAGFLRDVVEELTRLNESHRAEPWTTRRLPPEAYEKMLGRIVGFDLAIDRCEGKFKLGQNRSVPDRTGAAAGLDREGSAASAAVADFMRRH